MKLFCENSYRFKLHYPSRHTTLFQHLESVYTTSATSYRCLIDVGTTQCVYRDRFWQDSKHDFEQRNYLEKFGENLEFFFFFFDSLFSCLKAIFGPLARRQPPDLITVLLKIWSEGPRTFVTGWIPRPSPTHHKVLYREPSDSKSEALSHCAKCTNVTLTKSLEFSTCFS